MLFHKPQHIIAGLTSVIGALILILVIGQQPAVAEQASVDPHAHHHHMMQQNSVKRTFASYDIPDVTLVSGQTESVTG